jgi:hypothetical protein
MIFRPDRTRRGEDPALGYKMLFFVFGAVFGVAGIATERAWLIYLALLCLVVGVVLRVRGRHSDEPPAD